MRILYRLRIRSVTRISFLLLALLAVTPASTFAQDQAFPLPATTGVLGVKDATALAELVAFTRAAGAYGWRDLQGTGTLSYQDGETHNASLYLLGPQYSRLDIEMESGLRSVRLNTSAGAFQNEFGEHSSLLPVTSRAGIVAFPKVWTDALDSHFVSLYDRGLYTGTGQALHRITIEYQLTPGGYNRGDPTVATDLYFDPSTHALLFSVDSVQFANSADQPFLQVMAYGVYQAFNGFLVPTSLVQTLNGQPQWALQLNQVTINTNLSLSTFSF
jgi:hypothetical protein